MRNSFNSLQTGKCIQRGIRSVSQQVDNCFNSLQTGKCIQSRSSKFGLPLRDNVSIPFKRESVSKVLKLKTINWFISEFQFPSNGKVYPKCHSWFWIARFTTFQFPSNGKVYPKRVNATDNMGFRIGFQFPSNGKVYPKSLFRLHLSQSRIKCFNSLQTGKCIQRFFKKHSQQSTKGVSIPFKRESVSKG